MKGTPYERKALDKISLKIDTGSIVGIIGHTGSGKSTLIQHLNGLLKPMEGTVFVKGINTAQKNLKELRKLVGLIFQYPEHQLFEETVFRDIAFGLYKQGLSDEQIKTRVYSAAEILSIDESLLSKSPFELSGGQKRRVAIAGVIAMRPEIIVFDEPTAGLDPAAAKEVYSFIKKIHNEEKRTVIIVSHSMEDMAGIADKIVVMNEGRIEMVGAPNEVFVHAEALKGMGLDVPQITQFMQLLSEHIEGVDRSIFTVEHATAHIYHLLSSKKGWVKI